MIADVLVALINLLKGVDRSQHIDAAQHQLLRE